MKKLVLFLLLTSGLFASDDLKLILSFPGNKMIVGHSLNAMASIENTGNKNYHLVLPGDGSNSGWRTPIVGFSAIPVDSKEEHPKEIPLYKGGRCGNINPLKESEVFTLKPGEKKDLGAWVEHLSVSEPGDYRVVFYYQNDPKKDILGLPLGKHAKGIEKKIRGSTSVYLMSNEVVIKVEANDT